MKDFRIVFVPCRDAITTRFLRGLGREMKREYFSSRLPPNRWAKQDLQRLAAHRRVAFILQARQTRDARRELTLDLREELRLAELDARLCKLVEFSQGILDMILGPPPDGADLGDPG